MPLYCLASFLLLALRGGVYADPECSPSKKEVYDYVVVGAGTAGSVAAAKLAELLPDASILLIDQGRDFSDLSDVMDNDKFVELLETPYCEHHFSTEKNLARAFDPDRKRKIYICVSKILGGASSINAGGWYRAPESDLDEWAALADSNEWKYDSLLNFFKEIENFDRSGQQAPDRGYEGIIPVAWQEISPLYNDTYTGFLSAINKALGVDIGEQDNNGRNQSGINTLQMSRVKDGCFTNSTGEEECVEWLRAGSAYNEFVRSRQLDGNLSNLEVLSGAKVIRLKNIAKEDEGEIEVEYMHRSWRYVVKARKEVLLSAGPMDNPKIAMLSGIGTSEELNKVGISTRIESPAVGKHLLDHEVLWVPVLLTDIGGNPFDVSSFMNSFNSINFFFKSDESLEFPDMEILAGTSPAGLNDGILLIRIYQNKMTYGQESDPNAGGSMKLRTDNPDEEMDVTRNWYPDEASIEPMLKSLKKVFEIVYDLQANVRLLSPNPSSVNITDDGELRQYIKDNVRTEYHLMGSMRMGTPENGAVVDWRLKIIGSNMRVRVADTSIFPTSLRGHPMATAMAVGLKAGVLMADEFDGEGDDGNEDDKCMLAALQYDFGENAQGNEQ